MRSSCASSILLDPRISNAEGDATRTAEIVAKAVLLARDDKITDPTILRQLVH
jgi:hypothetical protein